MVSYLYDEANQTVVLFGGAIGSGDCCLTCYNDTWTWDGFNGTEKFRAISPPARAVGNMV